MLNLLIMHQVPILPRLLLIMVLEVMAEAIFSTNFGPGRGRDLAEIITGNNTGKPQCQLCRRFGHEVKRCYYRFDPSFVSPTSFSQNSGGPRAYFSQASLIPQLCLQHLTCSMITLGTLILVLQNHVTTTDNNLQHNTEFY
ncbi:hypothetical protein CK203_050685 [Vitis vinifera]|uniref:Uncharacterized protein n=1 Tax=Vitis vinifera TaxID=29760 RepID=A0A438H8X6_VITVI|nr:hypothetical protein CK203_050685 [Vitis vinifera]